MYYLKVNSHFDAAHFLRDYQGKCANIHGHTWQVQIVVKGSSLNRQGLLIDFGILKNILNETLEQFDHQLINNLNSFNNEGLNPTSENIAEYLYNEIFLKLPDGVELDSIEVWESPNSSAIYRKEQL